MHALRAAAAAALASRGLVPKSAVAVGVPTAEENEEECRGFVPPKLPAGVSVPDFSAPLPPTPLRATPQNSLPFAFASASPTGKARAQVLADESAEVRHGERADHRSRRGGGRGASGGGGGGGAALRSGGPGGRRGVLDDGEAGDPGPAHGGEGLYRGCRRGDGDDSPLGPAWEEKTKKRRRRERVRVRASRRRSNEKKTEKKKHELKKKKKKKRNTN